MQTVQDQLGGDVKPFDSATKLTENVIMFIYRKEVSWTHREQFDERLEREYCREKVVSVGQQGTHHRRPRDKRNICNCVVLKF